MSWFSGWGAAAWSEDLEAAVSQAEAWAERTASARGWSAEQLAYAGALIRQAGQQAADAGDFWAILSRGWPEGPNLPGWDKLGDAFASAAGAAATVAEGREAGSLAEVVGGTVAGAAEDLAGGALWLRRWGWLVGLVLLLVGAGAWGWSRGRR